MAGSVLGYRVYRLRRLIGVCLGLVALGISLGIWLIPEQQNALQVVMGLGVFSIFAMAHLAMIVIWPADSGGPLAYAMGTMILLAVAFPAGAHQLTTGTEPATLLVIALMLGPFMWLIGAPWLGGLVLVLANKLMPRKAKQTRAFDLPLDLPRAMKLFALDPNKTRVLSVHGPVGWDGFFEETTTRLTAGHQTGVITALKTVSRLRHLASDATTRSVLLTPAADAASSVSIVVHQAFEATANGTRLTERLDIDGAPGIPLWLGWLSDGAGDYVTAELDADAGRPPRAIAYLPLDSMGLAMARYFKWGDPHPG